MGISFSYSRSTLNILSHLDCRCDLGVSLEMFRCVKVTEMHLFSPCRSSGMIWKPSLIMSKIAIRFKTCITNSLMAGGLRLFDDDHHVTPISLACPFYEGCLDDHDKPHPRPSPKHPRNLYAQIQN